MIPRLWALRRWLALCIVLLAQAQPHLAQALERVELRISGPDATALRPGLEAAAQLTRAQADGVSTPQDVLSLALQEYSNLLDALYAQARYGATVSIQIDGAEAALIDPFATPGSIKDVIIAVQPGPAFRVGTADIGPLPPGTPMPTAFRPGAPAGAASLQQAIADIRAAWRQAGFAKARVSAQRITANHATAQLALMVRFDSGPPVRLGTITPDPDSAVNARRVLKISGLYQNEAFSPQALDKAASRLRRSGAFQSVRLLEAEDLSVGNRLDIAIDLVDQKPRRFGLGAELSSMEGLRLGGFWMHRNLFGGAERLRIEGEVSGIGGQSGGTDAKLHTRYDRPASFGPDTHLWITGDLAQLNEPDFSTDSAKMAIGMQRVITDNRTAEIGLALSTQRSRDVFGRRNFSLAALPMSMTWEFRNTLLSPSAGSYLSATLEPYAKLGTPGRGLRAGLDARRYWPLGQAGTVFAGRAQLGTVMGEALADMPPNFLYFSGGGGTVRGHPYQSLGVAQGSLGQSGGRSFMATSLELRQPLRGNFSMVGFWDAGFVGAGEWGAGGGQWHAGAGLGLRYDTTLGPIRLDLAGPVSGTTGDGLQFYIGIGQAF